MVFSIDPGALHRPLGVAFGADVDAGADPSTELGWIGVDERADEASCVTAILPPRELAAAAGRVTRARLARDALGNARGIVFTRSTLSEPALVELADAVARAAELEAERVLVVARPRAASAAPASAPAAAARPRRTNPIQRLVSESQASRAADFASFLAAPARPAIASARGIIDGQGVSVLGIAAGRALPRRSDALVVLLLTDARLTAAPLERLLTEVADRGFGTIAGLRTPSPDDAFVAIATGAAGLAPLEADSLGFRTLLVGATAVAQNLARQLLERTFDDARIVQITVSGASSDAGATRVVEALAEDESVRLRLSAAPTAGADAAALTSALVPAIREAGEPTEKLKVDIAAGARGREQVALRIDLSSGTATATRWTAVAAGG